MGGVVLDYNESVYYKELSSKCGVPEKTIFETFNKYYNEIFTSKISQREFIKRVSNDIGIKCKNLSFEDYFIKTARANSGLIKFIKKLRGRYKIALFTNVSRKRYNHSMYLLKKDTFDYVFASCFTKLKKPDIDAYEYVLRKCKVKPNEALFIDDLRANVAQARMLGLNAILFKDNEQIKKEISKTLMEIG
ncbi:MAG: HAD-IA family hydrolase [Candidatus Marsarchaeota archaeon]|nr:HAD-IA family hydrolase [Candidatus Marsarchaeota archaeon]